MNNNICVVDEVKFTADMGIASINEVLEMLECSDMKKVVEEQMNYYKDLSERANKIICNANAEAKTKPVSSFMAKAMLKINTLMDNTASKISELMINGTQMGVITIMKVYNKSKDSINPEIKTITEEALGKLDGFIENLKAFL